MNERLCHTARAIAFSCFIIAPVVIILISLAGCRKEKTALPAPEVISLLGQPLYRTPATGEALTSLEKDLTAAASRFEANPDYPDNIILYGQALSRLWRYHEAINIYTRGIQAHPDNAMLYRYRGHRYISTREFDRAVSDLERAAELNDQDFDIWYHLGLAYYLQAEFERAEKAYSRCREVCRDDGSIIAVSNWLYLTLIRQGRLEEAAGVLEGITENMDAGENVSYYNLLLFDKGARTEAELETAAASSDLDMATTGYGLACRLLIKGQRARAAEMLRKIIALPYWPAFGYIAAEVELHRSKDLINL
ncbi:MAG: tetratricopeptide repeat protein [Candidatus Saccharicenans sp.]|nr:tetratricopeptide repeat protein [Candidatus Saccharicenans sp.]